MRVRTKKGVLVASTDPVIHLLTRKLVIEVIYTPKQGVIRRNILGTTC